MAEDKELQEEIKEQKDHFICTDMERSPGRRAEGKPR